eukprot:scaffold83722_cov69-Phaeocystis_antarctica.AAC.7
MPASTVALLGAPLDEHCMRTACALHAHWMCAACTGALLAAGHVACLGLTWQLAKLLGLQARCAALIMSSTLYMHTLHIHCMHTVCTLHVHDTYTLYVLRCVCTAGARPHRLHHVLDPQDARPRAAALQGHLRRAVRPRGALHAAAAAAPAAAHHRLHPRAQAQEDCGGGGRRLTMRT